MKDLLRKQDFLKKLDGTPPGNKVVGCVKRPRDVRQDAQTLRSILEFSLDDLKATKSKEDALDLLIERFEANQVLVSRSQQNYMPRRLTERAKFSGTSVPDKKAPSIFLMNGDDGDNYEPAGRSAVRRRPRSASNRSWSRWSRRRSTSTYSSCLLLK